MLYKSWIAWYLVPGTCSCSDASLTCPHVAGDWQSDSLLHRLCTLQKKTALVILHKEILDFAERCVSSGCMAGVRSIPASVMRLTNCVFSTFVGLLHESCSPDPVNIWLVLAVEK